MDHLAQGSMKNAASCETSCELQDTWTSTFWTHIAEWGFVSFPCLLQGRFYIHLSLLRALGCGIHLPRLKTFSELVESRATARLFPGFSLTLNSLATALSTRFAIEKGKSSSTWLKLKPRPEFRQDYPPNLNILISGGKENNHDSLSSGEWTGISSSL